MTVATALAESLNVPTVKLADKARISCHLFSIFYMCSVFLLNVPTVKLADKARILIFLFFLFSFSPFFLFFAQRADREAGRRGSHFIFHFIPLNMINLHLHHTFALENTLHLR